MMHIARYVSIIRQKQYANYQVTWTISPYPRLYSQTSYVLSSQTACLCVVSSFDYVFNKRATSIKVVYLVHIHFITVYSDLALYS